MKRLNNLAIALLASTTLLTGCEFMLNADVDIDARTMDPNDPCAELLPSTLDTLSDQARQALNIAYQNCIAEPPVDPPIQGCDGILPDGVDPDSLFDLCIRLEPQFDEAADGEMDNYLPPIGNEDLCRLAEEYWSCIEPTVPVEPPICGYLEDATNDMDAADATDVIDEYEDCFPTPDPCDDRFVAQMSPDEYEACFGGVDPVPDPCAELADAGDEQAYLACTLGPDGCQMLFESGQLSKGDFVACVGASTPVDPDCEQLVQDGATDDEFVACVLPEPSTEPPSEPNPCDELLDNPDASEADYERCLQG